MPSPACWRPDGRRLAAALLSLLAASAAAGAAGASVDGLRLNDIQLLGSHNSYKLAMPADRLEALRTENPQAALSLDYAHAPLLEQLDLGLRKLEIDVFNDPDGTLFSRHRGPAGASRFPVLHVQNLDDRSHCENLRACLAELVAWSSSHPGHLPVFLSFNAKDDVIERPGFVRPLPFDAEAWDAFDGELDAALGGRLLRPAEVFDGDQLQWPTLDAARGRFLAVLDEGGAKRQAYARRWRQRSMFANLPEDAAGAAVLIVNDPLAEGERIRRLVRDGFIVRTRADADTVEARQGDVTRRDAAFASGAQLVSTDYYQPAAAFGTGYHVVLPGGGAARCNPERPVPACTIPAVPRVHPGSGDR